MLSVDTLAVVDPIDGFYQALDSEELLRRLGPQLRVDAQQVIAVNPDARVAGLIALPDSAEAELCAGCWSEPRVSPCQTAR